MLVSEYEIKVETSVGITTFIVNGSLYEQSASDQLSGAVRKQLGIGNKSLVIDLSQCKAISSYGVGQLIALNNSVKSQSGTLTFVGLRKEMKDIMAALLLDQILTLKN